MSEVLAAGTEIAGRYQLLRLVGEGGMGSVWQADDLRSGGVVALKFVKEATASANLRRRLLREAKAACTVSHPSVVQVHDILELEDGSPVMVMEFLDGESLAARLERIEAMPLEELAPIMQQVVSAVGTAHALGVVHRDIKPENIFLATRGDGPPEVKILDFGIAKLAPSQFEATHSTELTKTGALVGTPCYMAPEQVYGEKDVDSRADIWALGLILYRALSGILPTQADNVGQVMKIITARRIWPLAQAAPDVPDDVSKIVDRMLSRQRDQRPGLIELREVLARYTDVDTPPFSTPALSTSVEDVEPISDRRAFQIHTEADPMAETAPGHEPERRSVGLAVTIGAALVAVAAGWWALKGPDEEPQAAPRATDPPMTAEVVEPVSTPAPRAEPTTAPIAKPEPKRAPHRALKTAPPPSAIASESPAPRTGDLGAGRTVEEPPF